MIDHIKKVRNKNHMVTSIYAEKVSDKFQHPLIEILNKVDVKDTYFNITKGVYDKPTANTSRVKNWKVFL